MSKVTVKTELLVCGLFPFDGGEYTQYGYTLKEHVFEEDAIERYTTDDTVFYSPYLAICTYLKEKSKRAYLSFEKEEEFDLDYSGFPEYDRAHTVDLLEKEILALNSHDLEKYLTLIINNRIVFPVRRLRVFDKEKNLLFFQITQAPLNLPSLLSADEEYTKERILRQNNRINVGIDVAFIDKLRAENMYFSNAYDLYYASFDVVDMKASLALLISSLEAFMSKNTYEKVENCKSCGQKKYRIVRSVSDNVSILLLDNAIKNTIKNFYDKRSKYLHSGYCELSRSELLELQEIVHKALLMYWAVGLFYNVHDHKEIMNKLFSKDYDKDLQIQAFSIFMENTPFAEKRENVWDIVRQRVKGINLPSNNMIQ